MNKRFGLAQGAKQSDVPGRFSLGTALSVWTFLMIFHSAAAVRLIKHRQVDGRILCVSEAM